MVEVKACKSMIDKIEEVARPEESTCQKLENNILLSHMQKSQSRIVFKTNDQ